MTAWLSVLVPLLVMFFALGMERVESRLRESAVRQDELEELLEQPRPDEVRALFRSGTNRAREMFRLRHRLIGYPAWRLPPLGGRLSPSVQHTLHLHP